MATLAKVIKQKLKKDLENSPLEYCHDDFINCNKEIRKHFNDFKFINKYYKKHFSLEKEYFELLILKNSQLILSLNFYFNNSKKARKDYDKKSFSYKCLDDFWKVFTVINNNYIALKDLLLNGKDYQAKVIFRNTIELTELSICFLGDEEFYSFFKTQNKSRGGELAFQTVKFQTIKKTTLKIISQIKLMPNNNIPHELWTEYLELRQDFYEDTSQHIHSNFLNLMLGSHVQMIETDHQKKDRMIMNLGGIVNKETGKNIKNVITYDAISYMIILILLISKHKLFFAKLDKNVSHLTILSKLNWDLLPEIINKK
jgi:hypothetical protein